MSKEIKFRAWDKTERKWLEIESFLFWIDGEITNVRTDDGDNYSVEEVMLLQYTGLKDKNGVEIYEGDIVKGRTTDHEEDGFYMYINGEVGFDNGSFNFKNPLMTYYRWTNYEVEVIGNILEDGDLLDS